MATPSSARRLPSTGGVLRLPLIVLLAVLVQCIVGSATTAHAQMTTDSDAPLLVGAAANFEELLLTYNEALDEGQIPLSGEFTATAGADDLTVVAVQVLGSRVTLTLTPPVAAGDTVTVSYSGASAMSHLRDPTGNPAADFVDEAATNGTREPVYDTDGDGLIEIASLAQLDAIRHDLDGDGHPVESESEATAYRAAFPDAFPAADARLVCTGHCLGYELQEPLDFDTDANGLVDSGDSFWHGGQGWAPIGTRANPFTAVFDGNGHTIRRLFVNRPSTWILDGVGLFGNVEDRESVTPPFHRAPLIHRVRLTDVDVTGYLGSNSATYILGSATGGLVGAADGAQITASQVAGRVSGTTAVGGLVGKSINSYIAGCYATARVSGTGAISPTGGLVGWNITATVSASYATGTVSGIRSVGGLVGSNEGMVVASYATGRVSGERDVGGLVGEASSIGRVVRSYWDTDTSGLATGNSGEGQTTTGLQGPTDGGGIYANWNTAVSDHPPLDADVLKVADPLWHFGTNAQYPALKADFGTDGTATWSEFGHQLRARPTLMASGSSRQVSLSWDAVDTSHWSSAPTVTYAVLRHDGSALEVIGRDLDAPSFTDTDVTADAKYDYQVVAVVDGGEAVRSPIVALLASDFTFAPAFAVGAGTTESDTDVYTVSENSTALRLSLILETPRGVGVADIADPVVVTLATRENAGLKGMDEDHATQRRSGTFGDFGQFVRDLSFAPGDFSDDGACGCARADRAVSVDLFNDRVHERDEVFGLRLSRKSGRFGVASMDITARIAEDDAEPVLTLDADPVSIAEAGGVSTVTVGTGSGSTFADAQTIRLDLSGTAARAIDYTVDSTVLTLPAGTGQDPSSVTTTVRAKDDPVDDDGETVVLAASRDGVEFARRSIFIDDDETGSTRVDLAVNPAQVREDAGATTVRLTASLNADARGQDTEVTVTVGASGDSAVEGTDYATVSDLTLTIDAGETTADTTFSLDPTNNDSVGGAKTITVDGSTSGLAVRLADLTLNDDDVASTQVTLTLDPREVSERAGSRTVRVTGTLDGMARATATVVTVTVGSGADTALEGTDYADVPELELTIAANRTEAAVTFTLRPTNDRTAEGTETISVRGNVAGLTVISAELALVDDEVPSVRLELSLAPSRVSEAAAPTDVVVTGSLDAGARTSASVVTVTVGESTDTATEGVDYANVSSLQITVPANETSGRTTFTLAPQNDPIVEGAETISFTGRVSGLTVAPATLTLSENDTLSRVLRLSVDPESVSEDTPGNVTVTASLNAGARAEDTEVRLTVGAAADTAVPGTDYERVSEQTLTILAGETSGTAVFRLEPFDNDSTDGTRTLSVTGSTTVPELRMEPAAGAKVALEDDDSPAVLVVPDILTVVEAESNTYTVELQTRPTADVTVTIGGVSGDLSLDKTSLVFTQADWRDPQPVEVTAADDDDSRQDPDVTLTHRASGAAEYRRLRADLVVSIRENDPSLVFSGSTLDVREGQAATYTVALATVPTADVTVQVTGVSGDVSLDQTRLVFTPGRWDDPQTITVEAAEDDDSSTNPAVTLTHRASGGGYDGISGTVRVTITENDGGGTSGGGSGGGGGGGGGGGSANRPPVVTDPIGAQVLELAGSVRIDATEHFRDPDNRTMTFEVESADVGVATVAVDGSIVTIEGIAHGVTTVTVTAVDHRRLRVSQSFEVSVGYEVSFASAEVSAPEGGTAMLRVVLNRPREAATTVRYVLGVDVDPATPDADAADHDGMDGEVTIATGATEASIGMAIRDDTDIEPPRESFTVTLQATEAQLQDFGLGIATVRVTIDEGVCDRTRQVRNALRRSLPCAAVSATDLAARTELDLANRDMGALQADDLSGLSGLTVLDLSGNALTSLPEGMFAGLGALAEVQLYDNPGAPFPLQLELVRMDGARSSPSPARVVARVREGAPFAMRAALSAVNGTLSPVTALVPAGMTAGTPIAVTQDAAGATRVTAAAAAIPDTRCGVLGMYRCFQGLTTAVGGTLVLFKAPPEVKERPSGTTLAAEGDAARIDLSALFAASDAGALTYFVGSSDPGLASATVDGDTLTLASNEDGREGTVTITVIATDDDGLSVTLTFEVTVESMPRGLLRGWRRVLLEQAMERQAAEVE